MSNPSKPNQESLTAEQLLASMKESTLLSIATKVIEGRRIDLGEGLFLLTEAPLEQLRQLADFRRQQLCGEQVRFATTLFIHPTNLCELSCPMCSFYAKPGWKSAWFLTPEQVEEKVVAGLSQGIEEVHLVGGLWKQANMEYYQELFTRIHRLKPQLHIKALTPVEYDFLAKLHQIDVRRVLSQMKEWGLGSLPGGGAEILVESIRRQIAPQKIDCERYLEIHRIAHEVGLPSNITMLYGHLEEPCHIIAHLDQVRRLQDQTGGLRCFVPLKYHTENNALGKRLGKIKPKSPARIYATSRLMLDNIPHLKVLWNYLGIEQALEMLDYGGDDLGSTALQERIVKMAGGIDLRLDREGMSDLIRSRSRIPKVCHSGTEV